MSHGHIVEVGVFGAPSRPADRAAPAGRQSGIFPREGRGVWHRDRGAAFLVSSHGKCRSGRPGNGSMYRHPSLAGRTPDGKAKKQAREWGRPMTGPLPAPAGPARFAPPALIAADSLPRRLRGLNPTPARGKIAHRGWRFSAPACRALGATFGRSFPPSRGRLGGSFPCHAGSRPHEPGVQRSRQ